MRLNPFLTAVGVGVGTMVTMGGTTIVVSGMGMAVAKRINRARMLKSASVCSQCDGEGYISCQICHGSCIVRTRKPQRMSQIMKGREKSENEPAVYCSCPACGTSRYQRCLNCLGLGKVL